MEDWEKKEELVKLIEKVISPSSHIERDVKLPNLKSKIGAKRQCDVVIRTGKPPRETISIVEVQKRGIKVDINTFGGWCVKMRDVGAQHLICVSEKGFPKSIIEEAQLMGPTIRLLTLAQLESIEGSPLNFISNTVKNPRRELTKITGAVLNYKNDVDTGLQDLDIKLTSRDFRYNGFWMTAKDLFFAHLDYLEGQGNNYVDGKHKIKIKLPLPNDEFYFRKDGDLKEIIEFSASYEVDIINREMELTSSEYKQVEYGTSVAWVMETSIYQDDKEKEMKIVLIPEEDATYRLQMKIG